MDDAGYSQLRASDSLAYSPEGNLTPGRFGERHPGVLWREPGEHGGGSRLYRLGQAWPFRPAAAAASLRFRNDGYPASQTPARRLQKIDQPMLHLPLSKEWVWTNLAAWLEGPARHPSGACSGEPLNTTAGYRQALMSSPGQMFVIVESRGASTSLPALAASSAILPLSAPQTDPII